MIFRLHGQFNLGDSFSVDQNPDQKREMMMCPYQMEKADIATVAFFRYPASKTKTALYHNSKLLKKRKKGNMEKSERIR
jgi:hypothetical protein